MRVVTIMKSRVHRLLGVNTHIEQNQLSGVMCLLTFRTTTAHVELAPYIRLAVGSAGESTSGFCFPHVVRQAFISLSCNIYDGCGQSNMFMSIMEAPNRNPISDPNPTMI